MSAAKYRNDLMEYDSNPTRLLACENRDRPRCYFDTKGHRAKVKLDKETGRLSIQPSRPVLQKDLDLSTVSKMVGGGYLFLPKKCDLSKEPTVRHEGPQGQLLVIDMPKLPEHCTEKDV